MGEAVQQRGRHFCVAKDGWPFAEGKVGGDDDGGALIEAADQVEEQLPAGLGEGQLAQFVEDDEVEAGQIVCHATLLAATRLGLQSVDQIDDIEEAATGAAPDEGAGDGDPEVGFAGSGAADQDDIALVGDKATGGQFADQTFIDRGAGEVELVDVFGQRQFGDGHLIPDGSCLLLCNLGL